MASLNALAEHTLTHQSTVSVVVARLVVRGLVGRSRSKLDGRRLRLSLTPAGRAVLRGSPRLAQTRLFEALQTLSPSQLRALASTLTLTVDAMGLATTPPGLFFDEDEPFTGEARRAARRRPVARERV